MKIRIFFLTITLLATSSYALNLSIAGAAIDKSLKQSQKKFNKKISAENSSHNNIIKYNKNTILNEKYNIFLIHKRNELILNQIKIRGLSNK